MASPKGHAPYPGCEKGGRPKIYTEEFIDNEADALMEWMNEDEKNIFIQAFCMKRGYHDGRIPEFCAVNKKFSDTLKELNTKQKLSLICKSLDKQWDFRMANLLLNCNHNMVPRTEQKIVGDVSSPLSCLLKEADGESKDLVK